MKFYDLMSGRYFNKTFYELQRILVEFNRQVMEDGMTLTYNDFYRKVGIPETALGVYPIGYPVDQKKVICELAYSEDGTCIIVHFGEKENIES